jgi:hypothetical protein
VDVSEQMHDIKVILTGWYAGEVGGEALFAQLARRAEPEQARKWTSLAQVEARVAARLAAAMAQLRLPIPTLEYADRRAAERCQAVADKTWMETMQWLQALVDSALRRMRADAAGLPETLAAIGVLVVRHEAALLEFAELELAGQGAGSLGPIEAFLDAA